MKHMKIIIPGLVIIVFALLFVILYDLPPIKVGLITDFSGKNSGLGLSARNGINLAIDEINSSGGIKGHKIELLIEDHAGSKEQCYEGTKKLVNLGVSVIISPILSGMASSVIDGVKGSDVLILGPTVSTDDLTGIDDNFIRIAAPASTQGIYLAEISMYRKEKNVVIILDKKNSSYSFGVAKGYKDTIQGSQTTIAETIVFSDKSEFVDIVSKLDEIKPDSILLVANGIDTANIVQLYAKEHTLPNLYGSSWVKATEVEKYGGHRVEGMIIADNFVNAVPIESEVIFAEKYMDSFNSVTNSIAIFFYESMNLYKRGIEDSNSFKTENIKNAIIDIDIIEGVLENYRIDEYGDGLKSLSLYIIKNNKYELYEK